MSSIGAANMGWRRLIRPPLIDAHFGEATRGIVAIFGGIGFWTDGQCIRCALICAGGADAPRFEIRLRGAQ